MKLLENKTVVVTGAMGGLGRELCTVAEAQGARVVRLDIACDEARSDSHSVDLTDSEATRKCFGEIGSFDALVNLAGGFAMGCESWESSDEEWNLMFNLNVATLRNAVKAAVPQLLQAKGGSIVNVGAYGAIKGQGLMGAYCASKSVVMRLTETLSEELKAKGINVNAVLPAIIDTPANRAAMPDADTSTWVAPSDLANVICFLASPLATAVHGALIPVTALR